MHLTKVTDSIFYSHYQTQASPLNWIVLLSQSSEYLTTLRIALEMFKPTSIERTTDVAPGWVGGILPSMLLKPMASQTLKNQIDSAPLCDICPIGLESRDWEPPLSSNVCHKAASSSMPIKGAPNVLFFKSRGYFLSLNFKRHGQLLTLRSILCSLIFTTLGFPDPTLSWSSFQLLLYCPTF